MDEQIKSDSTLDNSLIPENNNETLPPVRSLRELIELVSGRKYKDSSTQESSGLAEILPFPFLALVGQGEMKLALLLTLINPAINGLLLLGPRGTGKTTAVRSLLDLLPKVLFSLCHYGCMPQDIETGGIDAVCPECARKFAEGASLTKLDRQRLLELPVNSKIEDVIGGIDERANPFNRMAVKRGILSLADKNVLYIDEVNLLADEIIDATLDAAAQGTYTVHRGPISATYNAHFTLIGSMNPEEGILRSQIMDRFGLRVIVHGLQNPLERLEAYQRVRAYVENPRKLIAQYASETDQALDEIQCARQLLPDVFLPEKVACAGIRIIQALGIDSLRAEITLFESARAYCAADGRSEVELSDIHAVAPIALRLRRSNFITRYFQEQAEEDQEIIRAFSS
jgi:magnesium chelatase subunit I